MTTTASIPPITGVVTVAAPLEQAFQVFTGSIDSWWPHQFHIGQAEVAEVILEPHQNGRWYERGVDGTECDWGRVLTWDPPHLLILTWQINGSWQFDPDPDHASEILIRFTTNGPAETTVELVHSSFERLIGGGTINDAIRGGGGWVLLLDGFARTVAEQAASQS